MHQEVQAIVLAAGPGMRMTVLTSTKAKCLLPLGTLPMIYYPLRFLQDAGFTEVTVVVSSTVQTLLQKLVEHYGLKLSLDIAVVNTADDPGTADSLRQISHKIKHSVDDVVIVSCDMVTDAALQPIMDEHRARGAALTVMTADQNLSFTRASHPGPKTKSTISSDVICTDAETGQLMYCIAGGDYDETITLSGRLMSPDKVLNLTTSVLDAHMYIMKRWLITYMLSTESPCCKMGSLKAEIIPHIISQQFTKPPTKDRQHRKLDVFDVMKKGKYDDMIAKYNTSIVISPHHNSKQQDGRLCLAHHHTGLCARANNLNTYWELNCQMHRLINQLCPGAEPWHLKDPTADIQSRAQVSEDSMIGTSSVICEKTNITSSVVGNHCKINSLVRIVNSVLADHVTIAQGCVIENSLICTNIERKCTIKNCFVTDPNRIEENKTYTNEILEISQDYTE